MNKGVFYLLPFLALSQVVVSNPLPQVEVANLLNVLERVRTAEAPNAITMLPKPVSGRNINGRRIIKMGKPRAGRNVRPNGTTIKDKQLIRR